MLGVVAAGSNLGPRRALVRSGLAEVGRLPATRLLRCSPLFETAPERPGDGGAFLNGAALIETALLPEQLLPALLEVERRFGRRRGRTRGPRTLDLDLILLGGCRRRGRRLDLPHPRFRQRAFVLGPAARVAPRLHDPLTGATLARLLARLEEP